MRIIAAAVLALVAAGCGLTEPDGTDGLNRDTFVDVYVELRRASRAAADSADFAERKRGILRRHGVAAEELERFIDAHAGEVQFLAALWQSVHARVSPSEGDSASG